MERPCCLNGTETREHALTATEGQHYIGELSRLVQVSQLITIGTGPAGVSFLLIYGAQPIPRRGTIAEQQCLALQEAGFS